jgi:hypothetical protein
VLLVQVPKTESPVVIVHQSETAPIKSILKKASDDSNGSKKKGKVNYAFDLTDEGNGQKETKF